MVGWESGCHRKVKGEGNKCIHWVKTNKQLERKRRMAVWDLFKCYEFFNEAMLFKPGWVLKSCEVALVGRAFEAKYFIKVDFMEASLGSTPSYAWWISMWEAKEKLKMAEFMPKIVVDNLSMYDLSVKSICNVLLEFNRAEEANGSNRKKGANYGRSSEEQSADEGSDESVSCAVAKTQTHVREISYKRVSFFLWAQQGSFRPPMETDLWCKDSSR